MSTKCPFSKCKTGEIPVDEDKIDKHLIVTVDSSGGERHFHVHGPVSNKPLIQDMVTYILKESGIAFEIVPGPAAETAENKPSEEEQPGQE